MPKKKEIQKWIHLSMGAHYDGFRKRRDWGALKARIRFLLVAGLTVGIVLATPSFAYCPKPKELFIDRTPSSAKMWAKMQMANYGWHNKAEWKALVQLWNNESNWRCDAFNKTPVYQIKNGKRVRLHAGGIPQIVGMHPKTNVKTQIHLGMKYIKSRYKTPTNALRFWNRHNYY